MATLTVSRTSSLGLMPYTPHLLIAFGGSWTTAPSEVWECTIRATSDGGAGSIVNEEAYLGEVAPQLATWFHNAANLQSALATLRWMKANHVAADGTYVDSGTTHVHDFATPPVGGSPSYNTGYCSLAYTWETAVARGPGHRGRMYTPNCSMPMTTDPFVVSNLLRDQNATAGAGILALVHNSGGSANLKPHPVVASKIGGAIHNITGCTSDSIYDVQRRRKNRAVGTRSGIVAFA